MAYHKVIFRDLLFQIIVALVFMPISFAASAAVKDLSENATEYDLYIGQIMGMVAKYIIAPVMVFLAAYVATKIKSAADERIEDPKRTKLIIGIVAAFGVWFLAGWLYNLPFEARMPVVLTSTVLAPPILVNIYGYITELKTIASLKRVIIFFSRFKAAWNLLDSVDGSVKPESTKQPSEPTDKGI